MRSDIRIFDREVGRRHEFGQDRFHKFAMIRAAVQLDAGTFKIQWFKKRKAHQMVPMGMGKNKIEIAAFFLCQVVAQSANTGAGVDNNRSPLFVRISKQVVSPPYFKYSLPETGMDPLEPQTLIFIVNLPFFGDFQSR